MNRHLPPVLLRMWNPVSFIPQDFTGNNSIVQILFDKFVVRDKCTMSTPSGRVLIYGGRGALGGQCVRFFKDKNFWVSSVDIKTVDEADYSIVLDPNTSWTEQADSVATGINAALLGNKLDAVLCLAGGWAGGNASSADFIKNSDLMWKQSVWTSGIAAHVASKQLREGGTLALCGAQAALHATPGMIGYGMAKAAVLHLTKSLAKSQGGLPKDSFVVAICPVTLDTPMNRQFMPKADHSSWTPIEFVADLLHRWTMGQDRPVNGSLIQLITKDGITDLVPAAAFE